jgi:hypothetical protein
MATRKSTTSTTTAAPIKPSIQSTEIGRLVDDNVRLLARSSEVAIKAYVEIVKSFADRGIAQASARLVEQVAEGWKTALIDTTTILRNAYARLDTQIKPAPIVQRRARGRQSAR